METRIDAGHGSLEIFRADVERCGNDLCQRDLSFEYYWSFVRALDVAPSPSPLLPATTWTSKIGESVTVSLTSHFRDNNAVSCVGRGEGGGEMKVCATQRYNSPAYFPISFYFTLSQNIIQYISKSLSFFNSFWRSLFWFWFLVSSLILFDDRSLFWFRFLFYSTLFYFVTKYYPSLSLSLILFDTRSLFWFCFRFTRAYSNISLFYSITKYSSLSNSFWRSIFILVSFLLYLTLFYFVTKYLICFDYYHKVYSNITLFYFYKISKFL